MPFDGAELHVASQFFHAARNVCNRALVSGRAVVSHPMFLFSVGNNALALGEASILGFGISMVGTAAITAAVFSHEWNVRRDGQSPEGQRTDAALPYGLLACVNFVTAGVLMAERHAKQNNSLIGTITSMVCLGVWGIAHVLRAYNAYRNRDPDIKWQPEHLWQRPLAWTGGADIAAAFKSSTIHPYIAVTAPIALTGFIMALTEKEHDIQVVSKKDFFRKHITPSRALAGVYLLQSALLFHFDGPLYYVGATGVWGVGFTPFDKEKNKSLPADFRTAFLKKPLIPPPQLLS